MSEIQLTQGKVAIIDAADVPLVEGRNWQAVKDHNVFYAVSYRRDGVGRYGRDSLHRVILGLPSGVLPFVDLRLGCFYCMSYATTAIVGVFCAVVVVVNKVILEAMRFIQIREIYSPFTMPDGITETRSW